MNSLFIPSMSHWKLGNFWSGSLGRASYHVAPRKGPEGAPETLLAEAWTGPLCYELSTPERTQTFPVTEEGLKALAAWLEETLEELDRAERRPSGQ